MNNLQIAKETIRITKEKRYVLNGQEIRLPKEETEQVIVIAPDNNRSENYFSGDLHTPMCKISVSSLDSFGAAKRYENPLVLNFANAYTPGGGFLLGEKPQEETLCRCSTLYSSLSSDKAGEMYKYNKTHPSRVASDYMLLSPDVIVFRDIKYNLLEEPFKVGVITAAAPNKNGAALLTSKKLIESTFIRRIQIILNTACQYGYKNLVLGAWGCGAFGNLPGDVAECFRRVILDQGYGRAFDEICFAIYGKEDGKNISAFRKCFGAVSELTIIS